MAAATSAPAAVPASVSGPWQPVMNVVDVMTYKTIKTDSI